MDNVKITDGLSVGGQPSQDGLRRLAEEGVKTVVNLRTTGEKDQPLSPEEEGQQVGELGMRYVHIPVSMKSLEPEQVERFRAELKNSPFPVFVHCASGKRAGAFAMMATAVEAGMSGEDTLKQAESMGFKCDVPELKEFVTSFVDAHVKSQPAS